MLFVYNLYQTGRSRRTIHNSCTTQRLPTDFHRAISNNVQQKAFSYSSCTDLYGFPKSDPNSAVRLFVYNLYQTGRFCRTLYNRCVTPRLLTHVHQVVEYNVQ